MISQGRSRFRGASRLTLAAAAIAALVPAAVAVSSDGSSSAKAGPVGAVYTQTNSPAGNKVVVFDRFRSGKLRKRQHVPTGGDGSVQSVGCGPGCPILDSQNAVVVGGGGKWVFAVNAGSDTVTSFRETANGRLRRVNQVSSGGDMPESLAIHGNLLYVLNVNTANSNGTTGNIFGMRIAPSGRLSPIANSSRPLANFSPPEGTPGGAATARGIGFKPNGEVIVVTELAANMGAGAIDTFVVRSNGRTGPAVAHPSSRGFPFGFDFNTRGHLVVSNLNNPAPGTIGSVSTYRVTDNGNVIPIDTRSSRGELPCWVVVTDDNRFTYVVNTGDGPNPAAGPPATVARFGLRPAGDLRFRGLTSERLGEYARTDAALSRGSNYLYVLSPSVGPGPPSHIDVYRVTRKGGLAFIHKTPVGANLGVGATGLAAR